MIAIRKKHAAFGGSNMEWIETGSPAVAAYIRQHHGDTMLILNNLSFSAEIVKIPVEYQKEYLDLFAGHTQALSETLTLPPYSYLWLQMQNEK
jgi:maltose alpha-D-glucosyltransferase/alpha-amylase